MNAVYKLFPLKEEELDDFFAKLRDKESPIFGLNVTVPYKEKVLKYLDEKDWARYNYAGFAKLKVSICGEKVVE